MSPLQKLSGYILASSTLLLVLGVFLILDPIPQPDIYHHFAHEPIVFGVPRFWNVISNIGFILTGVWGLILTYKNTIHPIIIVRTLFIGIVLTGFGSMYYHLNPTNATLIWDRIPMTVVFGSLLSYCVSKFIHARVAIYVWFVLMPLGIISVLYWYYTETIFAGDLRLYALIQFLPVLHILVLIAIHATKAKKMILPIFWMIVWYAIAKCFEHFDHDVYQLLGFISGHPIKHIAASISTFYIIRLTRLDE